MRSVSWTYSVVLLAALSQLACGEGEAPRARASVETDPGAPPTAGVPDSAHAPRASVRVAVLGTSLTAGLGIARDSDTWPAVLAERARSEGFDVELVNAGVSGETSAGGLRRLDWILRTEPDVLIVELGANDGLRGQDPGALEENLRQIIRRARAARPGIRIVLAGMRAPPNMGAMYTARFDSVFPRLAREERVALIPFLLDGVAGVPSLNQADGIHPTPEGHRIMAENAWTVLDSVLVDLEKSR